MSLCRCRGRLITFLGSVSAVGTVSVEIVVEEVRRALHKELI
jgi:hypothetical protein